MRILTASQIKQADQFTITTEEISSNDLMSIAGRQLFHEIVKLFPRNNSFSVFCGPGNNGGDGLVIAQYLYKKKKLEALYILNGNFSPEFNTNLTKIKEQGIGYVLIEKESHLKTINFSEDTIIVDALYGVGISRPLFGLPAAVIQKLNSFPNVKVAIDVPSGLSPDLLFISDSSNTIKADITLSVQLPKLAFMFPENQDFVGDFICVDIGLSKEFIEIPTHTNYYVTLEDILPLINPRKKFGHKGDFGHALMIGGSKGKIGAGILSATSCLRSGCGLLTCYFPEEAANPLLSRLPEAMFVAREYESEFIKDNLKNYHAIGYGPGIGISLQNSKLLHYILTQYSGKLVIDADGLNILSQNQDWYSLLNPHVILTPHPGEFDRLTKTHKNSDDRFQSQLAFSKKHNVYIVLKGHHSSITCPDGNAYFNSTGNNGMSTAGSGDVLTGILTSLCAQGYAPDTACKLGVYIHGYSGDIAAQKKSKTFMLATDIIENLKNFFLNFES